MPTRTAIIVGWLILFGTSLALLACVAAVAWWQRRRELGTAADRQAEHDEWVRHAATVAEQAEQATLHAGGLRAVATAAEQAAAAAWQELEQAEQAHDEAARAYTEATSRARERTADSSGQREVANAALAAFRRGDLSRDELWRVWRWGSGWDPEVERCEHQLARARTAQREARLRYRLAAGRERATTSLAEVAEVRARALAEETAAARDAPAMAGWRR